MVVLCAPLKPGIAIDERYASAGTWMDKLSRKDGLTTNDYRTIDTMAASKLNLVYSTAMYFLRKILVDKYLGPSGNNRFENITAFELQSGIESSSCQELEL